MSLRTLYRDIAALAEQGARIEGEPGVGYVLRPGFTLPPLMFSDEEIEAILLGSGWTAENGDERLAAAARGVLAKIAAVLPERLAGQLYAAPLLVGPSRTPPAAGPDLPLLRQAIREERKTEILYRDAGGRKTRRIIWPVAIGFFDEVRVAAAWCELRGGFRHFRTDRMASVSLLAEHFPESRLGLYYRWRVQQGFETS